MERVSTIPHLVNVEYAVLLVVFAGILIWSMLKPAPLGPIANPFSSPNPAKAAWYFMGLQELLLHMHPLAALALVGVMVAALLLAPMRDRDELDIGVYFRSALGRRAAILGAVLAANLTPLLIILDEYLIDLPAWLPGVPTSLTIGVFPFAITLFVFWALYRALRKNALYQNKIANHSEALLGVFAFAVTGLLVMTVVGIFFRGANMALGLPF